MILEGYLLYQEYQKQRLEEEKRKNKNNREFILAAASDESSSSSIGVLIFLMILLVVSIALAIACAYFIFSCIRKGCMSFILFLVVVLLLNVPFVNIAIFIILLVWWLTKCRKSGQCQS